jgi:hypothetical protein
MNVSLMLPANPVPARYWSMIFCAYNPLLWHRARPLCDAIGCYRDAEIAPHGRRRIIFHPDDQDAIDQKRR